MGQGFQGFMQGGQTNPNLYTPEMINRARWQALTQLGAGLMAAGQPMTGAQRGQLIAQGMTGAGTAYQDTLKSGLAEKEYLEKQQEEAEADKWRQMAQNNPEALRSMGYNDAQIEMMKGMPKGLFEDIYKARIGQMFEGGDAASWKEVEMLDENGKPAVYLFDPKNPNAPPKKLGAKQPKSGEGGFDDEAKLRAEYLKQASPFIATSEAYGRVQAGAAGTEGADDIALVYGFMKMLDPTSAVREGEYATAEQVGGAGGQFLNLYNRLVKGDRLTPEMKAQLVNQATKQYQASRSQYEQTRAQFSDLSKQYGFDPNRIALDLVRGVTPTDPNNPLGLD